MTEVIQPYPPDWLLVVVAIAALVLARHFYVDAKNRRDK